MANPANERNQVLDALGAINNAIYRAHLPDEVRPAFERLRDAGRDYIRALPPNAECTIHGLKGRISLELPEIDEGLRQRVGYAVMSIIGNATRQKPSLIPENQFQTMTRMRIPDQARSESLAIRYLINPIQWVFIDHQFNPMKWCLGDGQRLAAHKTAGNDALDALGRSGNEGAKRGLFRRAVTEYNAALHYTKNEQQRIPIYFKIAQAYLHRVISERDFQADLRDKEVLLFNDTVAKYTYGRLRAELLYLSETVNKSTSVIQKVLKTLLGYYEHFAKEAREGRDELEQYRKAMPSLAPIREALLAAPDLDTMPDVRIALEDLPQSYESPDDLQKALTQYDDVMRKMQRLDSSFKMSEICAKQQNELEILALSRKVYREKYEQLKIYAALTDLISLVAEFSRDMDETHLDVLSYAEHHPETLVKIFTGLSQLGDLDKLPPELVEFKEDMVAIREGFLMRATASERMGRVLCEFFEKLSSRHPEKVAKEALKSLKLPFQAAEDGYLMAYKDYNFAAAMFNTAVGAINRNIEKRKDTAYEAAIAGKAEEERSQIWRDQIPVPALEADQEKLAQLQPLVNLCKAGIDRVIKSVLDNPRIGRRGQMLFSDFMEEDGKTGALNHIASGKWHYASQFANPATKYERAINKFQQALKMLLDLRSKADKIEEQTNIERLIGEVRLSLNRATLMKKAADKMESAYQLIENPALVNTSYSVRFNTNSNRISRTQIFNTLRQYVSEAAAAENEALKAGLVHEAQKEEHLRRLAETEKTNYIDLSRMAAEIYTKINDAKNADSSIGNAALYAQRGFKSRGDYQPLDLEKMERLIKKLNDGEITAQELGEEQKKKQAFPFLDDIAKSDGGKRNSL